MENSELSWKGHRLLLSHFCGGDHFLLLLLLCLYLDHNESKRDVTYSDDHSFHSGEDSLSVSSEWAKPTTPTEPRSLKVSHCVIPCQMRLFFPLTLSDFHTCRTC